MLCGYAARSLATGHSIGITSNTGKPEACMALIDQVSKSDSSGSEASSSSAASSQDSPKPIPLGWFNARKLALSSR